MVQHKEGTDRIKVVTVAKRIKDVVGYSGVFVNLDLTVTERELDKKLRFERDRLNKEKEQKERHFYYSIRNDQIVRSEYRPRNSHLVEEQPHKAIEHPTSKSIPEKTNCMYVRSDLSSVEEFSVETNLGKAEQVWCGIKIGKDSILIGCIYRTPDLSYESNIEILTTIKRARRGWTQEGVGHSNIGNEKNFLNSIDDSFLTQVVNFTAYKMIENYKERAKLEKESILDPIFTSEPIRLLKLSKGPILSNTESGHYKLHCKFSVGRNTENKKLKMFKLIRKASFEAISADF